MVVSSSQHQEAVSAKRQAFQIVAALGLSFIAMIIVPVLGYLVLLGVAVASWIKGTAPAVRWTLTLIASTLFLMTFMAWGISGGDSQPDAPPEPTPSPSAPS
jgi:hypothetical protein